MADTTPINYGITADDYVVGLEAELAAAVDADHKAAIAAELKTAKAQAKA